MAQRLSKRPVLCAVLDAPALGATPYEYARGLFEAGVDWIQLRDRSLPGESLLRLTRLLVEARDEAIDDSRSLRTVDSSPTEVKRRVIVNRRVDIAFSAGADGVHLGFDAMAEGDARQLLPENAIVGHSFHSPQEVESHAKPIAAENRYAHLAPIWDPISKKASRPALGLDLLAKACALGLPILAQGGIDEARAAEAVAAGVAGIAVTGTISGARNPTAVARQLRRALDQSFNQASK